MKYRLKSLTFYALKELIGNIAGTIQLLSENVHEPIINQNRLDDLERLRAEVIEATGIKYTHEDGVMHPLEIIETMQNTN